MDYIFFFIEFRNISKQNTYYRSLIQSKRPKKLAMFSISYKELGNKNKTIFKITATDAKEMLLQFIIPSHKESHFRQSFFHDTKPTFEEWFHGFPQLLSRRRCEYVFFSYILKLLYLKKLWIMLT